MKTKEEQLKIYSAYLPYRLEYKLPLSSGRYYDLTDDSWWKVIHTLETAIDAKIPEALELRDMVMCQRDPFIVIEDERILLGELYTNLGFELDDVFLDEVKPILYPLSYLTQEIEHEGEIFVPILEVLNYLEIRYSKYTLLDNCVDLILNSKYHRRITNTMEDRKVRFWFSNHKGIFFNCSDMGLLRYKDTYGAIQKLLSWHLNIFGLEEDQFINKATLKKN